MNKPALTARQTYATGCMLLCTYLSLSRYQDPVDTFAHSLKRSPGTVHSDDPLSFYSTIKNVSRQLVLVDYAHCTTLYAKNTPTQAKFILIFTLPHLFWITIIIIISIVRSRITIPIVQLDILHHVQFIVGRACSPDDDLMWQPCRVLSCRFFIIYLQSFMAHLITIQAKISSQ